MSATLAPSTSPLHGAAPPVDVSAEAHAEPAAAEFNRWLVALGTPFVLGAFFFALSVALSAEWLIGVALMVGPMLFIFMTIYLCLSSDSNGTT